MNSLWLQWVQMLGAAAGTINPAAGALVSMIVSGVTTVSADTDEFRALNDQWFTFCQNMIAHGGPPTDEERAAARAFADAEHVRNQGA